MHPHVVIATKKTASGRVTHLVLSTGSVITQNDVEHFVSMGCQFVTEDAKGNRAQVKLIGEGTAAYLRTVQNGVETDNLNNLPVIE
jgi:hypothetical protein